MKRVPIFISDLYKFFKDDEKSFIRRKIRNKDFLITGYEFDFVEDTLELRIIIPFKRRQK